MQGTFQLMREGQHIGMFNIDSESDTWKYTAQADAKQPLVFQLLLKQQNGDSTLSGEAIKSWILGRAPEPDYHFIGTLMEKVGIREYDPLAFVVYNSGRFNTDRYYLEGDGMTYKWNPSMPHLRMD